MKKGTQKEIIWKILKYIQPYSLWVFFSLLTAAVSVALTLYVPVLTGQAVDQILGPGQVDFPEIFRILRRIGVIVAATMAAQWVMNVCNNRIVYKVTKDIRERAF